MMSKRIIDYTTLGVINMTPNSFSDGNVHLDHSKLHETLTEFLNDPKLIFDFGFESTAPMNEAISAEEERARFFSFLDMLDVDLSGRFISFDTYRPSSYTLFESEFKKRFKGQSFLFNDVSGVLDLELLRLLQERKNDPSFFYLYSATRIPSRDLVSKHMSFADKNIDIVDDVSKNFKRALEVLSFFPRERLILDPCFGFSKNSEQNWELIEKLPSLFEQFSHLNFLIGLSKKSFLRARCGEAKDVYAAAEILHETILKKLVTKVHSSFLVRAHDPALVRRVYARL